MSRPRLIIHIGTHKTGTTAIQNALKLAAPALAAEGILVPRTDRPPWPELPKHCSVYSAAASAEPARRAAELAILEAEFESSSAHTMLLTEEGLGEPNPSLSAFFAPLAERFELHVVCFLRRPDRFVESLFNQFVRETERQERRNVLQFSRAPGVRERLDYHSILQRWQALPARVHALAYDERAGAQDLLDRFTLAVRPFAKLEPSEVKANQSPDMRVILAIQRLSIAQVPFDLRAMLNAAANLRRTERFQPCRTLLGRDERRRLLIELAPMLARLKAGFGIQFDDELPEGEAAGPTVELDLAYLVELAAVLSKRGDAE